MDDRALAHPRVLALGTAYVVGLVACSGKDLPRGSHPQQYDAQDCMVSIKPPEREHMTLDWPNTGQGPAAPPPPVIGRHRWILGAGISG